MEYRKRECLRTLERTCEYCENTPLYLFKGFVSPVPRPFPDYNALPEFHYSDHGNTPKFIDGKIRPPDDFQPRVQLKRLFETGAISSGDKNAVNDFGKKYIVGEKLVIEYLIHLEELKMQREKRKEKVASEKHSEAQKEYKDYDWANLWVSGQLQKKSKKVLKKYIDHHKLGSCKTKQEQLKKIVAHLSEATASGQNFVAVRNQLSFTRVGKEQEESESTDNDSDSDDDVILAKYGSSDCSSDSSMQSDSGDDRNDNQSDGSNNDDDSILLRLCGQLRTRHGRVVKPTARSSNYLF